MRLVDGHYTQVCAARCTSPKFAAIRTGTWSSHILSRKTVIRGALHPSSASVPSSSLLRCRRHGEREVKSRRERAFWGADRRGGKGRRGEGSRAEGRRAEGSGGASDGITFPVQIHRPRQLGRLAHINSFERPELFHPRHKAAASNGRTNGRNPTKHGGAQGDRAVTRSPVGRTTDRARRQRRR